MVVLMTNVIRYVDVPSTSTRVMIIVAVVRMHGGHGIVRWWFQGTPNRSLQSWLGMLESLKFVHRSFHGQFDHFLLLLALEPFHIRHTIVSTGTLHH